MHPLYDVSAIVENPSNVFRIDSAREMWVTMVPAMLFAIPLTRLLTKLQKVVPDEVFRPRKLPVLALVDLRLRLRRYHVVCEFGEVVLQLGLA